MHYLLYLSGKAKNLYEPINLCKIIICDGTEMSLKDDEKYGHIVIELLNVSISEIPTNMTFSPNFLILFATFAAPPRKYFFLTGINKGTGASGDFL